MVVSDGCFSFPQPQAWGCQILKPTGPFFPATVTLLLLGFRDGGGGGQLEVFLPTLAAAWQKALPAEGAVVFCNEASGDEEVPQLVKGLIVARDLPVLSHLALRARHRGFSAGCAGWVPLEWMRGSIRVKFTPVKIDTRCNSRSYRKGFLIFRADFQEGWQGERALIFIALPQEGLGMIVAVLQGSRFFFRPRKAVGSGLCLHGGGSAVPWLQRASLCQPLQEVGFLQLSF